MYWLALAADNLAKANFHLGSSFNLFNKRSLSVDSFIKVIKFDHYYSKASTKFFGIFKFDFSLNRFITIIISVFSRLIMCGHNIAAHPSVCPVCKKYLCWKAEKYSFMLNVSWSTGNIGAPLTPCQPTAVILKLEYLLWLRTCNRRFCWENLLTWLLPSVS